MSETTNTRSIIRAIAFGVLPAALALGVAVWAMSPGGMAVLVSSTILSLTWWIAVPFGMVIATTVSRRMRAALAVALTDVVFFHVLIVMSRPPAERLGALLSGSNLLGAAGTMLLPILIGAVLGYGSIANQPVHHDGVPRGRR